MLNDDKQPIPAANLTAVADVKHAPAEEIITGEQINALIKSEQYAAAIKLTNKVLANKGLYNNIFLTNTLYIRGRCFFEMQNYPAAYRAFTRCLLKEIYFINPLKPLDAHYHCGIIAAQNKSYQQAITHFSLAADYKDSRQQKIQTIANRNAARLYYKLKKEVQHQLDTFKYKIEIIQSLLNKIIRIQTKSQDYVNAFKHIYALLIIAPNNMRAERQLLGIIPRLTSQQLEAVLKTYFCDATLDISDLLNKLIDGGLRPLAMQILIIFVKLNPNHELASTITVVNEKDEKTTNPSAALVAASMATGSGGVLSAAKSAVVLGQPVVHTCITTLHV